MISALIEVGQKWLDPDYSLRKKAIQVAAPEFCLSPANFELALNWIFSFWNQEFISKLHSENKFRSISKLVQVIAGNTPAVIAQAFLQGAVMQVPQIIKIPSLQSTFPRLLHASFNEVSSELGSLFYLDTWKNNLPAFYSELSKSEMVIAYGSDETIALLKSYCVPGPGTFFLAEGHAVSCAIIFKQAANRQSLKKLGLDMLSYDQRGCLSPRVVFIEQGGKLSPAECAGIFAKEILPDMALQLPRGGLFPGEAVAILQRSAIYGFRGTVYTGFDWTVSYDDHLIWPEEILPRFLPFKSFSTKEELDNVLESVKDRLISIGVSGDDTILFNNLNVKLISELGQMQKQFLRIDQ